MSALSALWPPRPRPRRQGRPGLPLGLRLRLAVARHRRVAVALLLGLAVAAGLQASRPPAPATTQVLVAVRDLPAGHRLDVRDVTGRAWPRGSEPAGLLPHPQGRVLSAPLRRGEPITDVRVAAPGRTTPGQGRLATGWVAVAVRLTDPAGALLVSPGDRVQVIAGAAVDPVGGEATTPARVLVADALVLTTPSGGGRSAAASTDGGGLLGALGPGRGEEGDDRPAGGDSKPPEGAVLPAGVLALGVREGDALQLAAVGGVRALSVARQFSMSS